MPLITCERCGSTVNKPCRFNHSTGAPFRFCSRSCANQRDGRSKRADYSILRGRVLLAIERGELDLPPKWTIRDEAVARWLERYDEEARLAESYAARSGWPPHLTARQTQVMNVLAAAGLPTRSKELAACIGISWEALVFHLQKLRKQGLVSLVKIGVGNAGRAYTLSPSALSMLLERTECESRE